MQSWSPGPLEKKSNLLEGICEHKFSHPQPKSQQPIKIAFKVSVHGRLHLLLLLQLSFDRKHQTVKKRRIILRARDASADWKAVRHHRLASSSKKDTLRVLDIMFDCMVPSVGIVIPVSQPGRAAAAAAARLPRRPSVFFFYYRDDDDDDYYSFFLLLSLWSLREETAKHEKSSHSLLLRLCLSAAPPRPVRAASATPNFFFHPPNTHSQQQLVFYGLHAHFLRAGEIPYTQNRTERISSANRRRPLSRVTWTLHRHATGIQ